MIAQVRTARPSITLNGKDYYQVLSPYFETLEYTDNCDGEKADDLQIDLADRDKRFISDWMPDKGAFLDVGIIAERWFALNGAAISLDCGRFWIDSINFQMPGNKVAISGTSIPITSHIKAGDETRGWESSSLRDIAQQIAGENGMSVDYQATVNPRYKRVEQTEESALAFLKKLANDAKLSIKVHRSALVIFDEEAYEAADPKFTLVYGNDLPGDGLPIYKIGCGDITTKFTDTTKKARVRHNNPETGLVTDEEFVGPDEDLPSDFEENVNEDPGYEPDSGGYGFASRRMGAGEGDADISAGLVDYNLDDGSTPAQRKAKSVVRNANKDKDTANIDLAIGNPLIAAGMTFNLVGVGQYSGKWFVTSAKHTVGPMYTTSLEIRRCLIGY